MTDSSHAASPEGALQRLFDERDITATAIRYTWALDANEWDLLDDVFVPDATACFMGGATYENRDAIKDRISSSLTRLDNSQHIVSNHEVTFVDADTARHRCYLQAQHVRAVPEGSPCFIIAGRYEDDMVRTADGWRISHRELIMMWTDGNPAVVAR